MTQNSGVIQPLNSIHFVDASVGWIVGDAGTILDTTDSGASWTAHPGVTTQNLNDVYFVDGQHGWAVGDNNTVLATTDGGSSWSAQTPTVSEHWHGVYFTDLNHGWIVGTYGNIQRTTDGGQTWTYQYSAGTTVDLLDITFGDADNGWIVGRPNSTESTILYTADGGASWLPQHIPLSGGYSGVDRPLYAVSAVDGNRAWVAGSNLAQEVSEDFYRQERVWSIFATEDGGATWTHQAGDRFPFLRGVEFVDLNHGFAVGGDGTMLETTDGGATWQHRLLRDTGWWDDVDFANANIGWIIGRYGTVWKTMDGGATWTPQNSGYGGWMYELEVWDTSYAWIGVTGNVAGNRGVLRTSDGGAHWYNVHAGMNLPTYGISFVSSTEGWMCSEADSFSHSVDGGANWVRGYTLINSGNNWWNDVDFVDARTGWLAGRAISSPTIARIGKTTDGGVTWTNQAVPASVPGLLAVFMVDAQTGWASGFDGAVVATTDGGDHWVVQDSGVETDVQALVFLDEEHGWAVGWSGVILAYTVEPAVTPTPTPTPTDTSTPTATPTDTPSPTPTATPTETPTPSAGKGHIYGFVFEDTNGDHVLNDGERLLADAVVDLKQGDTVLDSITTSDNGLYSFYDWAAGTYTITETNPPDYTSDPGFDAYVVNLVAGAVERRDFPDLLVATPTPTATPSPTPTPTPTSTPPPPTVVTLRVSSSLDDAHVRLPGTNLEAVAQVRTGPSSGNEYVSGLRFANATIPQGARVVSATLHYYWIYQNGTPVQLRITGEASDNPDPFADWNTLIPSRPRTNAQVDWDLTTVGNSQWYDGPDVGTIVQEVVDRAGWASRNALALFLEAREGSSHYLDIAAYDWAPTGYTAGDFAAQLSVAYLLCAGKMDFDCSGRVDTDDVSSVAVRWNTVRDGLGYDADRDLDYDGDIDIVDVQIIAAAWGATIP